MSTKEEDFTKVTHDADASAVKRLHNLKRRRARERGNITRFVTEVGRFNDTTALEDYEYYQDRLREALGRLTNLDDEIHELIDDSEYDADVQKCEEYIESAKRAILRTSRQMEKLLALSTANVTITDVREAVPATAPIAPLATMRLPPIKLEPFSGDIETWARFWEQFTQSIDNDPSLSTINKHIFLRGYLEEEPKHLVEGIAVIAETYEETKKILEARYGDKNRIIQAHLDYLEDVKPIQYVTPEALNSTYIDCNRRIQALRALGEDVNGYGRVLAPKILRAFPDDICRRWIVHAKREGISEGDILQLMAFLGEEVDGALTTQKIRGESSSLSSYTPTAATLHVHAKSAAPPRKSTKGHEPFCVFCDYRGHWAQDCKKITDLTERIERLKRANRCFLCLNKGHTAANCGKKGKAKCAKCKRSHHVSICDDENKPKTPATHTNATSVGRIEVTSPGFTYLQTAQVWITGPTGLSRLTRCVLDGGSQSSFIATTLIDDLKLQTINEKELTVCAFESRSTKSSRRRLVRFNMKGAWTNSMVSITAYESAHTLSAQPAVPQDVKTLAYTRKLQLADPKEEEDIPVEILIGGDHYWKVVKDNPPIRISTSAVLVPTMFGWILSGSRSGTYVNSVTVNFVNSHQTLTLSDEDVRRFWDLETIGISANHDRSLSAKDAEILEEFRASFRVEDQRRVVSLPKRQDINLPSNRINAEARLNSLMKRLENNEELKQMYYDHMLNYITRGQVETAPPEEPTSTVFYLPHQAVKKEKHGKTKWRIVFDASSHENNSPSLNDVLEMGPNLLPEIVSILLRFRLHPTAIVSDITQAFLQLVLDERDRDLTRFFWYRIAPDSGGHYFTTGEVITYRFSRLPFGLTCSPFLLSATLREHADRHVASFPMAAPLIDSNTFMDDFVAGAEDDNSVIALYYEIAALMKLLNFPLSKWASNSEQMKAIWKAEGQNIEEQTQVLGVNWDTENDCFSFDPEMITIQLPEGPTTKRHLLQTTARFYDPLGLYSPVSIVGKMLFQDTWCRGLDWNELLPFDLGARWHAWVSSLTSLSQVHIPRWLATTKESFQVHVFCDASERAYGAALYIRSTKNDETLIRLACSKNRLAPVKRITLPRLELLAALVGARLLHYFCRATDYDINQAILWSDATVALGWIRSDPNKWKTFVCNRVTEIQTHTNPAQWRHCPGQDNPADHLSRGLLGDQIQSLRIWWHGPSWLARPAEDWPTGTLPTSHCLPEEKRKQSQVLTTTTPISLIDASRFSSYWRLVRTTAWILRFLNNVRRREKSVGELTAAELTVARMYWVRVVQEEAFTVELQLLRKNLSLPRGSKIARYNPFLEDGFIRLGGRLQCADLPREQQHPLLLDGDHRFTELLILQTHIRLHHFGVRIILSQLRSEFWILRARQTIKRVLHTCLVCKVLKNPRGQQIEAPLPSDRVKPSKPFAVTGIDFAGPLYIKVGSDIQKAYITLFTCATTRAVHLELCTDMSTDKFLMALQRFVGRRGIPHTIYTDNARTFHAANFELSALWKELTASKTHQFLAHTGITWKFIAPRAAWWGGWWERMVGTMKRCLRKVLGQSRLTEEQLNTTLVSIEAAVNSRPITQGDDSTTLTPAHFLIGEGLTTIPTGAEPIVKSNLAKELRIKQKLSDDFWKRWTKEYLLELRNFHEVQRPVGKTAELRLGDVVLIQEDVRPRHLWGRARIEELRKGRDGQVRTVVLRKSDGRHITRPIQLVIPLEIDQGGEDVGNS